MTRRRSHLPHGAVTCETQPDGSVVCYIWDANQQTWLYEDPDDRAARGMGMGCLIGLAMWAIIGLAFWLA